MTSNSPLELSSRPGAKTIGYDVVGRKSWPGFSAEFVRIASPADYQFRLTNSTSYLALFDIYRAEGETVVPGLPRNYLKDLRNRMTFVPKGCPLEGWARISKPASYIAVYLDHSAVDDGDSDPAQCPPAIAFEDRMLRSTLTQLQTILHDDSLDLPGYAETLGAVLGFEIERFAAQAKRNRQQLGGLTMRQVRLVVDYMDSHLTGLTSISEMSALLDLSRFHFIRAFKQTVGVPPHQFVIRRRVERAKELLTDDRFSITEIAEKAGFRGATQLTRAFRQIVGTTPTDFRRQVR